MKRDELITRFELFVVEMHDVMLQRNQNYATTDDALKNINCIGLDGIEGHLRDKISRLNTAKDNIGVINDTCVDIANYAFLYKILYNTNPQ